MNNNAYVDITTTEVPGNQMLQTQNKTLYYLIIKTEKGDTIINIGKGTYDKINTLVKQPLKIENNATNKENETNKPIENTGSNEVRRPGNGRANK